MDPSNQSTQHVREVWHIKVYTCFFDVIDCTISKFPILFRILGLIKIFFVTPLFPLAELLKSTKNHDINEDEGVIFNSFFLGYRNWDVNLALCPNSTGWDKVELIFCFILYREFSTFRDVEIYLNASYWNFRYFLHF